MSRRTIRASCSVASNPSASVREGASGEVSAWLFPALADSDTDGAGVQAVAVKRSRPEVIPSSRFTGSPCCGRRATGGCLPVRGRARFVRRIYVLC